MAKAKWDWTPPQMSKPKPGTKYLMICQWCGGDFNPYQKGPQKDCDCPLYVPPKKKLPAKKGHTKAKKDGDQ